MRTTHETLAQHTRHRSHRKSTHTHSLAHSHSHSLTHSYIRVAGESRAEWCHSPVLRAHKHLGIVHAATACGGPRPIRPFQLMLTLIRGGASSDSYSSVPRATAMTLVRRAAPRRSRGSGKQGGVSPCAPSRDSLYSGAMRRAGSQPLCVHARTARRLYSTRTRTRNQSRIKFNHSPPQH